MAVPEAGRFQRNRKLSVRWGSCGGGRNGDSGGGVGIEETVGIGGVEGRSCKGYWRIGVGRLYMRLNVMCMRCWVFDEMRNFVMYLNRTDCVVAAILLIGYYHMGPVADYK